MPREAAPRHGGGRCWFPETAWQPRVPRQPATRNCGCRYRGAREESTQQFHGATATRCELPSVTERRCVGAFGRVLDMCEQAPVAHWWSAHIHPGRGGPDVVSRLLGSDLRHFKMLVVDEKVRSMWKVCCFGHAGRRERRAVANHCDGNHYRQKNYLES